MDAVHYWTWMFIVANAHRIFSRSLWRNCPAAYTFTACCGKQVRKQKLGLRWAFLSRVSSVCIYVWGWELHVHRVDRGAFGWNHEVVKCSVPWPVTCNCKFLSSCYVFQGSRSLTVYLVEEEERSPLYCWAAHASFPWPGSWCWHRAVPQVLLWWMVPQRPASSRGGGSLHLPAFGWRRTCGDCPCGIRRCLHSVFIAFQMEAELSSSLIADGNGLLKWTFAVMQSTHNGMLAVTGLH